MWQSGHSLLSDGGRASGRGFEHKVPYRLPSSQLSVLINLSRVNQVMERCRDRMLCDRDLKKVVDLRNRAHHQLLCLQAWDTLSDNEREGIDRTEYECCRLTALLYSTAVVFPQPPHSGWHLRLVRDIKALLTVSIVNAWSRTAPALLIWVLSIAGIASFRSPERGFFEHSLRWTLESRDYLVPKPAVRSQLKEFLWSDSACGRGFNELWDSLDLGAVGELDVE